MKAPLISLFFLLFAFNFYADDFNHEEQRMLSTLYVQTAAEHRASVLQTFKTATNLLPEAIENASWNALPNLASRDRDLAPAIIICTGVPFELLHLLASLSPNNAYY